MKHIKLFEEYISEEVYRPAGIYRAEGLIGLVMKEFSEKIKKIQYEGDRDETLREVNQAWKSFRKEAEQLIIDEVMNTVSKKDRKEIVYINVKGFEDWEIDEKLSDPKLNPGPVKRIHVKIPTGDDSGISAGFIVNIGLTPEGAKNGRTYYRRLGGGSWTSKKDSDFGIDIYGEFDPDATVIQIKHVESMVIDSK